LKNYLTNQNFALNLNRNNTADKEELSVIIRADESPEKIGYDSAEENNTLVSSGGISGVGSNSNSNNITHTTTTTATTITTRNRNTSQTHMANKEKEDNTDNDSVTSADSRPSSTRSGRSLNRKYNNRLSFSKSTEMSSNQSKHQRSKTAMTTTLINENSTTNNAVTPLNKSRKGTGVSEATTTTITNNNNNNTDGNNEASLSEKKNEEKNKEKDKEKDVHMCEICNKASTKKHWCRRCGRKICSAHSKTRRREIGYDRKKSQRICDKCRDEHEYEVTLDRRPFGFIVIPDSVERSYVIIDRIKKSKCSRRMRVKNKLCYY